MGTSHLRATRVAVWLSVAIVAALSARTPRAATQATYLGGADGNAVAIDPVSGDVIIGGTSSVATLPGTAGAYKTAPTGVDAVVMRLRGDLRQVVRTTFLGGHNGDASRAITIDPSPGVADSPQPYKGVGADAFVTRFSPDLSALERTTLLGGMFTDVVRWVVFDASSATVLVGGETTSPMLPGTAGGAQPMPVPGAINGYVARFSSDLSTLEQTTYFGPAATVTGIAVAPESTDVFVALYVNGPGPGASGGWQPMSGGRTDVVIGRFNASLQMLEQATYFGGNQSEIAYGMAFDAAANEVVITDTTGSANLPGTAGGLRPSPILGGDGFAFRVAAALVAGPATLTPTPSATGMVSPTHTPSSTPPSTPSSSPTLPPVETPTTAPTSTPAETAVATPNVGVVGDCNANRTVAINELILGVRIALGSAALDDCPAFDRDGNGTVGIAELVAAVAAALA